MNSGAPIAARLLVTAAMVGLAPGAGFAQQPGESSGCRTTPGLADCFTISARASLLSAGVVPAAALGLNVAFELTDRVALEGEAVYFTKARWATAAAATGSVRVAIGPFTWSDGFVPFVIGGGGVHRANIDLFDPRLLGAIPDAVAPGSVFCPVRGASGPGAAANGAAGRACGTHADAPSWGVGDLPNYFARRLGPLVVPPGGRWPVRPFVDPVLTSGAGVHVQVGERLILQPEARIWITVAEGDTRTAGVLGVLAGYSFD